MSENVTLLPNIEEDKLIAQIEQFKRQKPKLAEFAILLAEARFASYSAHVKAGFTPEQAMLLCR